MSEEEVREIVKEIVAATFEEFKISLEAKRYDPYDLHTIEDNIRNQALDVVVESIAWMEW